MSGSITSRTTTSGRCALAVAIADEPLHAYYETGAFTLAPGAEKYIALVVRMPEEVDNVANYRGDTIPEVELGVTVRADQIPN